MFERFTDAARLAMVRAREEARALNHPTVRVEHILLGRRRGHRWNRSAGIASQGLDIDAIRSSVQEAIGERIELPPENIYNSEGVQRAIEMTLREVLSLHYDYIGTEHLLLGLMRETDGAAAQVLARHGANLDATRQSVKELTNPASLPPTAS